MVTDHTTLTSHWLPRPVRVLVVARAVNQAGALSVPFLAVLLVTERGASVATAGVVVAVFGLASIPSRLAGGRLTQRWGGRPVMVAGLLLCAAAQVGIAAAHGLAETLVAVTALGLAFELYEPGSQALIADLTAPAHRPRAFGLFGAALAAGGLVAGLLGAVLGGIDLRLLFLADAVSCVVAAVLVRCGLPAMSAPPADRRTPVKPWRDPRLLAMLTVGTGFATLYLQLRIALPLTLLARGVPAAQFGLVLAVASLTVVLGQPLLGWRRLPTDPFAAMTLGYVVLAAGLALTAVVTTLTGFVLATVLWAVGDVLLLGHPFAVVADLAPEGARARYLAVFGTCWGVAGVVAPLLGGAVLETSGPRVLWLGCAGVAVLLAVAQAPLRSLVTERSGPSRAGRRTPRRRR